MEGAKKQTEKRRNHRWTHKQIENLLEAICDKIKGNVESFEKPTSQAFYEVVAKNANLKGITWKTFKEKMRHLRGAYIKATQWKSNTGAGILEAGDAKSVAEYLDKICPFYNKLDEIFGRRKHVNVPVVVCSTDSINELLANNKENDDDDIDYSVEVLYDDFTEASNSFVCDNKDDEQTEENLKSSSSVSNISFDVVKTAKKRKSTANHHPITTLLEIQNQRIELETKKFEWQREKEIVEIEARKIEHEHQLEIKKMELEMEERVRKNAQQTEAETELKKFELELKYKYNK